MDRAHDVEETIGAAPCARDLGVVVALDRASYSVRAVIELESGLYLLGQQKMLQWTFSC